MIYLKKTLAFLALALTLSAQVLPYPANATKIPSSALNPVAPTLQATFVAYLQAGVAKDNATNLNGFNGVGNPTSSCAQWTTVALHSRDLGLTLPLAPVAPLTETLNTYYDAGSGAIWVWQVNSPSSASCPPLPALVTNSNPPGTADIGVNDYGLWFVCQVDDTEPANAIVVVAPGETFKSGASVPPGSYQKYVDPFGAWYLKVN